MSNLLECLKLRDITYLLQGTLSTKQWQGCWNSFSPAAGDWTAYVRRFPAQTPVTPVTQPQSNNHFRLMVKQLSVGNKIKGQSDSSWVVFRIRKIGGTVTYKVGSMVS